MADYARTKEKDPEKAAIDALTYLEKRVSVPHLPCVIEKKTTAIFKLFEEAGISITKDLENRIQMARANAHLVAIENRIAAYEKDPKKNPCEPGKILKHFHFAQDAFIKNQMVPGALARRLVETEKRLDKANIPQKRLAASKQETLAVA
ncbi:MAG: hypothetical protein PHX43_01710 [Alphaproteobacteria bacterium]|nr:hypothetical protein [Alphaproteobacteria bacterium]